MKYFKINWYTPGISTFAPLYTRIMAGTKEGAAETFRLWFPQCRICHIEDDHHPYSINGIYSRYFKSQP